MPVAAGRLKQPRMITRLSIEIDHDFPEISTRSGIHISTLRRLDAGRPATRSTLCKLARYVERYRPASSILSDFLAEDEDAPTREEVPASS